MLADGKVLVAGGYSSDRRLHEIYGELLLVEQRPRAQSPGTAIALDEGEAILFPGGFVPRWGTGGSYAFQFVTA